jgi:regulatory protein
MRRKLNSEFDQELILQKIRHFCSYQERYIHEVEEKLKDWTVQRQMIPGIINILQKEGFLNEERFVKAFSGGKFRLNKWGRQKIAFELKLRGIPEAKITVGLTEINESEYRKTLKDLILRKHSEITSEKNLTARSKIVNFVAGKGYEMNLILEIMNELQF